MAERQTTVVRTPDRAQRLQAVTAALSRALMPEEVGAVVVQQGIAALGAYAGAVIVQVDKTEYTLLSQTGYAAHRVEVTRVAASTPWPIVEAAQRGIAIWLPSRHACAARYPGLASELNPQTRALAALPLLAGGRPFGALGLSFTTAQRFDAGARATIETLAELCAQALERARLFAAEQAARRRAELAADRTARLQQVIAALSEALTPKQVAVAVVGQSLPALGAQGSLVVTIEPDQTHARMIHAHGYPPEALAGWEIIPLESSGPLAEMARSGRTVVVLDRAALLERYPEMAGTVHVHETLLIMPLIVGGRLGGAMVVGFRDRTELAPDNLAFGETMAQHCAQALERARLYEAEHQLRLQAEAAIKTRDVFLSLAAHELKTPLTALYGYAQLLRSSVASTDAFVERDQRAVRIIVDQIERLNHLVDLLLDVTRIEQGRLDIARVPLDLAAIARQAADELRPTLQRHSLRFEAVDTPLLVEGDAVRLLQVLQNLLDNAVKYSPRGGEISVRATREGDRARVDVMDQGIGIPKQARQHLFSRYFRAANVDELRISGLGVGLYIVNEIVTLHGGTVVVEGTEGRGSTFSVLLPLIGSQGTG